MEKSYIFLFNSLYESLRKSHRSLQSAAVKNLTKAGPQHFLNFPENKFLQAVLAKSVHQFYLIKNFRPVFGRTRSLLKVISRFSLFAVNRAKTVERKS